MTKKTTFAEDLMIFKNTRALTLAAMLTAMSVVIGILCKNFLTFNIYYRITFENLPVIFAAILFGPFMGAAVGVCADLVSCLCSSNPVVNPIISIGALAVGLLAGLISHHISFRSENPRIALSVAAAHLVGQVIIKSIGKILWYAMPWYGVFIGLGFSVVIGVLEFFAIRYLMNHSALASEIGKLGKAK